MTRLSLWGVCVLFGACAPSSPHGFPVEHASRVNLPGMKNITLLYMGYVGCPDVCPLVLAKLRKALEHLPPSVQPEVRVMMVTVHPEETSEMVDRYVKSFHPSFAGLALGEQEREALARALGVMSFTGEGGYMEHMAAVYLVERGTPRYLYTPDFDPESLALDVQTLRRSGFQAFLDFFRSRPYHQRVHVSRKQEGNHDGMAPSPARGAGDHGEHAGGFHQHHHHGE